MRILQRGLGVAFLLCVVGAIYFSLRAVPLSDLARIDRAITEAEPVQEASDRPPFTTTIKGYTQAGDHLRANAARYLWYAGLALLVGLAVVWLVRRPLAE